MSFPQTRDSIPLPVPTGGVNFRDPLEAMPLNYSPWMINCTAETQSVKVRPAYVTYCTPIANKLVKALGTYDVPGSEKLYCVVADTSENKIYDISTSTPSLVETWPDKTSTDIYPFNFAKRLAFLVNASTATYDRVYDGSSWANWDGAAAGWDQANARVGATFKGRTYLFNGTTMYYGALSAVLGATTSLDLTPLFKGPADIYWAAELASPNDRPAENYFCFGNGNGEILVYAGDYPDANNWELIGKYKIAPVVWYNSIIELDNDIWIMTKANIVSLRSLMQYGAKAANELSISYYIDPYYTKIIARVLAGSSQRIAGAYWPEENKVYILIPGIVTESGTTSVGSDTMLVYNLLNGAWSIHWLNPISQSNVGGALVYYKNNIYFNVNDSVVRVSANTYLDKVGTATFGGFNFFCRNAYTNLGSAKTSKTIQGFEPVLTTDFSGTLVGMKAATDFGKQVSTITYHPLADGFNVPFYSVGAEGTFVQYRLEGATNSSASETDGLEMFSVGVVVT